MSSSSSGGSPPEEEEGNEGIGVEMGKFLVLSFLAGSWLNRLEEEDGVDWD